MDVQLLVLIAMVIAVLFLAGTQRRRFWPGRSSWQYQRVFSAGFIGLLLFVGGVIGWDLKYSHGWFQGTRWVDGPVWWQIGVGASLIVLAGFWASRVPSKNA